MWIIPVPKSVHWPNVHQRTSDLLVVWTTQTCQVTSDKNHNDPRSESNRREWNFVFVLSTWGVIFLTGKVRPFKFKHDELLQLLNPDNILYLSVYMDKYVCVCLCTQILVCYCTLSFKMNSFYHFCCCALLIACLNDFHFLLQTTESFLYIWMLPFGYSWILNSLSRCSVNSFRPDT